jgi:hypothetical protein
LLLSAPPLPVPGLVSVALKVGAKALNVQLPVPALTV